MLLFPPLFTPSISGSAYRCVFFQDNQSFGWEIKDSFYLSFFHPFFCFSCNASTYDVDQLRWIVKKNLRPFSLENSGEERPKIFIPPTKIRHAHLKHYIGIRVPSFLKVLLFVGTPCSTKQPSSWAGRCWRTRPPAARRWCSTPLPILVSKRWLCTSRGGESLWEKFRSNESYVSRV